MRTIATVLAATALTIGLAACSSSSSNDGTPSVSDLKAQFDKAGLSNVVDTQCLADKIHSSGVKINKDADDTQLYQAVSGAMSQCSNGKIPSLSTATTS